MERAAPCRSIFCLLLTISCLFHVAAARAQENPPSEPIPPVQSKTDIARSIQAKRAQIAALQEEVEQLETQLTDGQQVEVELKMYEVNRTNLRRARVDRTTNLDGIYTNEPLNIQPELGAQVKLMKALEKINVARMFSHDNFVIICGVPFTFRKGAEFTMPMSPDGKESRKVSEKEIVVTATPQTNGAFRLTLQSKLAQQIEDKTFKIGDQLVPALRINATFSTVEALPGQEVLVEALPDVFRTESIRTESGIREQRIEIATYFSIKVKNARDEPKSTAAVQPVSAAVLAK